jgi:hypothetical protein
MGTINPKYFLRLLHRRNVQVHYDWFLVATDHYTQQGLARVSVDLLMRNEGRYIDKIARASFGEKL